MSRGRSKQHWSAKTSAKIGFAYHFAQTSLLVALPEEESHKLIKNTIHVQNRAYSFHLRLSVMDYKSYQQVLDLSRTKQSLSKCKAKNATDPGPTKRRTKSGCLTCRSRKKKCDEEKIDGKCQACIRNFLDCCWSTAAPATTIATTASKPSQPQKTPKAAHPKPAKFTPRAGTGASAYPSPLSSPKLMSVEEKLLRSPKAITKLSKPRRASPKEAAVTQFVVTSFDKDRMLCQITSK